LVHSNRDLVTGMCRAFREMRTNQLVGERFSHG